MALKYVSLVSSIVLIFLLTNYGAFSGDYLLFSYSGILLLGLTLYYFGKKTFFSENIDLISCFATASTSQLIFQIIWTLIGQIDPLFGMTIDWFFISLPISVGAFIFPSNFLASKLWSTSPRDSAALLFFPSIVMGFFFYMFVLSGIIGN